MNNPPPVNTPGQNARALIKSLQETYVVFRDCSPLAIGIDKQLLARQPELERKVFKIDAAEEPSAVEAAAKGAASGAVQSSEATRAVLEELLGEL